MQERHQGFNSLQQPYTITMLGLAALSWIFVGSKMLVAFGVPEEALQLPKQIASCFILGIATKAILTSKTPEEAQTDQDNRSLSRR